MDFTLLDSLLQNIKLCLTCELRLIPEQKQHSSFRRVENQQANDTNICYQCYQLLPIIPCGTDVLTTSVSEHLRYSDIDGLCAATTYQWPVNKWIGGLKFGQQTEFAKPLGYLLARQLEQQSWNYDQYSVVPLHFVRSLSRGYNQSLLIAHQALQTSSHLPFLSHLKRRKYTKPQARLNQYDRNTNLNNAFVCRAPILGANVLLIDDVVTTGHTVNEAAKALKRAGANKVYVACCALKVLE